MKTDLKAGEMAINNPQGEVIKFCNNGDIYIKGELAENNKEVVDGIQHILAGFRVPVIPIKVLEVSEPGWYLVFDKDDFGKKELPGNCLGNHPPARFYEYCTDDVWRSETGHGVTLEDPDHFNDDDFCIGPISKECV